MAFIYNQRSFYYYARLLVGIVLITGCRTEQVAFQFQPSKLKAPQCSFVLSKSSPDSLVAQKGFQSSVAKLPLTGTRLQRQVSSFVAIPKTIRKQTRINVAIAKRNNGYSAAQKQKYRKPAGSLDGFGVFLVTIGIVLFVFFIVALISGSTLFSIITGIPLLLYLALIISNASGG